MVKTKQKSNSTFAVLDAGTSKIAAIIAETNKNGDLIVIGDARNNYRPINTETIDKLSKKFYNIYWMNPERSQYWNTGDSQFHHYQLISKKYSEVRNFEQLKTFINSINFKKVIK